MVAAKDLTGDSDVDNAPIESAVTLISSDEFFAAIQKPPLDVITLEYWQGESRSRIRATARCVLCCGKTPLIEVSRNADDDGRVIEVIATDPRYRLYMGHLMKAITERAGDVVATHENISVLSSDYFVPLLRISVRAEDSVKRSTFLLRYRCDYDAAGYAFYDVCEDMPAPVAVESLKLIHQRMTYLSAIELLNQDARYNYWSARLSEVYRLVPGTWPQPDDED